MTQITSKYVIILVFLTVAVLCSQFIMQNAIHDSESDSRIINISGRQRMLSQRIAKYALILSQAENQTEFNNTQQSLNSAANLLTSSHTDLKFGSSAVMTSEMNSTPEIKELYQKIEPHFQEITTGINTIMSVGYADLQDKTAISQLNEGIARIKNNEEQFLKYMNDLTFQYDAKASEKITDLSQVEWYLMIATLVLILSEIFFIFIPTVRQAKKQALALSELNLVRDDEKTFASSQIKEANLKIKKLRRIVLKLHAEKEEASKDFTDRVTKLMVENATFRTQLENREIAA